MSSFFDRLAQRTLGTAALASPRTPGLFTMQADPVSQPPSVPHTTQPASLAGPPADALAGRVHMPSATASPRSTGAAAVPVAAHTGDSEAVSRPAAHSHPARTPAPPGAPLVDTPASALMHERLDTGARFTASARPGSALATTGPGNPQTPGRPSFEPLVPPAAGPPPHPVPGPRDTPAPVIGQGTPQPRPAASGEPTVHITIGAIEVRTPASTPRVERVVAPQPRPGLSLNDYLRRGRGPA